MSELRPCSLITGASSGIGRAFCQRLADQGHHLVLTARRAERLETLAIELRERCAIEVTVLPFDLADPATPRLLCETLADRNLHIDWLVNNAGYGGLLKAPTELAWRLLPGMRERGYGRILNIASLAGLVPAPPGHTLYAAAKAYLIRFSQSLALENRSAGVHVCALCPGFTWSEFHDVTGTRNKMDQLPGFMWLSADEVARLGIEAVERGDAMHVPGRVNRTIKAVIQLMPDRLALALSARQAKRYRNTKL
jgi:short-subunit dehydrogenase